jgi:hypothetical protein
MNGSSGEKRAPRIDVELRLIGFKDTSTQSWAFTAVNSFGQEFICDELGLRGMGEHRMKLIVNTRADRDAVIKRMAADGLECEVMTPEALA